MPKFSAPMKKNVSKNTPSNVGPARVVRNKLKAKALNIWKYLMMGDCRFDVWCIFYHSKLQLLENSANSLQIHQSNLHSNQRHHLTMIEWKNDNDKCHFSLFLCLFNWHWCLVFHLSCCCFCWFCGWLLLFCCSSFCCSWLLFIMPTNERYVDWTERSGTEEKRSIVNRWSTCSWIKIQKPSDEKEDFFSYILPSFSA